MNTTIEQKIIEPLFDFWGKRINVAINDDKFHCPHGNGVCEFPDCICE